MINWKLRLKNKTVLLALATALTTFIYQVLAVFEIVPTFSQDEAFQFLGLILNILVAMGIVVDPTTKGIGDSTQALGYEEPRKE